MQLVFLLFCLAAAVAAHAQTICLNMIVKDENPVILRCLASVKPLIDYWVIVDTGSKDGTQEAIRQYMSDIPGELHERPWVDFAHNRNEALELAKNKGDYLLFMDADDCLVFADDFTRPVLDKNSYEFISQIAETQYHRIQLIDTRLNWKWKGVLHEAIESSEANSFGVLQGVITLVGQDGHRSQDPAKYLRDAQVLEKALTEEPHNSRYAFYLAESYRVGGFLEQALYNYKKRALMGGWDQEIFWALYQIGLLSERLGQPYEVITDSYSKAWQYRPSRAEPLYNLAKYYREKGHYLLGYLVAKEALQIPLSSDAMFVERWIYNFSLLIEFSNCAYWLGKKEEAKAACQALLAKRDLPAELKPLIEHNLLLIQ